MIALHIKHLLVCLLAISFPLLGSERFANDKQTAKEMQQAPPYLYKILSLRNWQATQRGKAVQLSAEDEAFIHLSTEDQLERILGKYWADAPQFVILKIDTTQLKGRLVLEANPGGTTKYYHLYDGSIPVHSIVEAKIVYKSKSGSH